jgi:hypothetical protein
MRELFLALALVLMPVAIYLVIAVHMRSHLLGGKLNENKQRDKQDNKLKTIGIVSPYPKVYIFVYVIQ